MKLIAHMVAAVTAALLLSGCVADKSHQQSHMDLASLAVTPLVAGAECRSGSHVLAHVEFDDQGWFHDLRQRQVLFNKLKSLKEDGKRMLIVAYTHGWKHNARENDDNLANFCKLLVNLTTVERTGKRKDGPRTVVGVYIGWRGQTVDFPIIENLTFWARKNAAERVGARSVKQLFIELNQFRVIANKPDQPDDLASENETQLIFVGHSFGGLITYHALYSEIMGRGLQVDHQGRYRMAKTFGDFVLLVNPAFEGTAYEPIWQAALTRGCYPPGQKPVMAIVTSRADNATRLAFPAGRLYTWFQSAPQPGARETVLHTVGHLDRYRTHTLKVVPKGAAADREAPGAAAQAAIALSQPNTQEVTILGDVHLIKSANATPLRMPYLVIQADQDMIADHNDFWNDRFRIFTVNFITSQILSSSKAASGPDTCPAFGSDAASGYTMAK